MPKPEQTIAPERYFHVSSTQLSVARHFGRCIIHGYYYIYDAEDDTLTRQDVYDRQAKDNAELARQRAEQERQRWQALRDSQGGLF